MKKYISLTSVFLGGILVAVLLFNSTAQKVEQVNQPILPVNETQAAQEVLPADVSLNGVASATLTPIKDPIPVRVPSGYDFSRVGITIDVMRRDQDGKFIDYESVALNLDDPIDREKLTLTQLTKVEEVAKILFKITNKIE